MCELFLYRLHFLLFHWLIQSLLDLVSLIEDGLLLVGSYCQIIEDVSLEILRVQPELLKINTIPLK